MIKTGAVIVAAGLSSRMGDYKAMLPFGNTTVSRQIVLTLKQVGADPIVVVTGYRAKELQEHLKDLGVIFAYNENYAENQMFDSYKIGMKKMEHECDRFFLMPVDKPAIPESIYRQVLSIQAPIVRTSFHGKPGHPILVQRECIQRLCEYSGTKGLRGAMESDPELHIEELMVEDRTVLWDVDTKEDYQTLLAWCFPEIKQNYHGR